MFWTIVLAILVAYGAIMLAAFLGGIVGPLISSGFFKDAAQDTKKGLSDIGLLILIVGMGWALIAAIEYFMANI